MLLYVDPGTLMPVASALAAIGGVLMMFWRRIVGAIRAGVQFIGRMFGAR